MSTRQDQGRAINLVRHIASWSFLLLAFLQGLTFSSRAQALPDETEDPGTKSVERQIAQRLADSFDAGDFYMTRHGRRTLRRLAGRIAVGFHDKEDQAGLHHKLRAPGGILGGYEFQSKAGLFLFNAPQRLRQTELLDAPALDRTLKTLQAVPGVRSAAPVFIDPETGLQLVPTSEIILRLKEGASPRNYFGAQWGNVRRLAGTIDQFIVPNSPASAEQLLAEVNRRAADPRVIWAEPNFLAEGLLHAVPDDPLYSSQWSLNNTGQSSGTPGADVNAPEAWAITTGSTNVIIAILDTGTQTTHPDLNPNLATNPGEIPGNGLDDDGNGYSDDVNGWDFFTDYPPGNNDPSPKVAADKHGTATAGIAVARGHNSIGIAGAAYTSRLLPIRIGQENGDGTFNVFTSGFIEAIYYAAGRTADGAGTWRGADVLSLSVTFSQLQGIDDALAWAATNGRAGKGCPIFAAAGNGASAWGKKKVGLSAGTYTFRWEYSKDETVSDGDDSVWLDDVVFPGGAVESFEGATFPPTGWTTGGDAPWIRYAESDRARGTGAASAKSGAIGDSQTTYLERTETVGSGSLTFSYWVSSEQNFDKFKFYINGVLQTGYTSSGVPSIASGISYPASHIDTIAVGASTDFDFRAEYSQFGSDLDFVAPSSGGSGNIQTTDRTDADGYNSLSGNDGDYFAAFSGTSAACPLAAGVGALVLSVNPALTAGEVRALLRATAEHIGNVTYTSGFNHYFGYGRINAQAAVYNAMANLAVSGSDSSDPVAVGSNLVYTITVTNSGPAVAGDVLLTNTLPASVNLISATGSYTVSGVDVIYNLGRMTNGASTNLTIVVNPLVAGTINFAASVSSSAIDATSTDNSLTLSTLVNALPTISNIADQTIVQDTSTKGITFTIGDAETAAGDLLVSSGSSDPSLVPEVGIVVAGSGINRTVTITPASLQHGAATIQITLTDTQGGTTSASFVLTVLADTDGDGLPDSFELAHGLNPNDPTDAAQDSDGDGFTNLEEFLAGTDPQDPASTLAITDVAEAGTDVQVSFVTTSGKAYRVERNDIFPANSWTLVADNVAGTGGVVAVLDPGGASQAKRLYRVAVVP